MCTCLYYNRFHDSFIIEMFFLSKPDEFTLAMFLKTDSS